MLTRSTAVAAALALCGCVPTCLNGSLDLKGNCVPVNPADISECVMRAPGDRCLDTGTCNMKQECEVPGVSPAR